MSGELKRLSFLTQNKLYFYPVYAKMKNYPCEFSRFYKPLILNKITFCLSEELNYPKYNILQKVGISPNILKWFASKFDKLPPKFPNLLA